MLTGPMAMNLNASQIKITVKAKSHLDAPPSIRAVRSDAA